MNLCRNYALENDSFPDFGCYKKIYQKMKSVTLNEDVTSSKPLFQGGQSQSNRGPKSKAHSRLWAEQKKTFIEHIKQAKLFKLLKTKL